MGRPARGAEVLDIARLAMSKAETADQLRICQAVVFPLEYGMSTAQTAACIGRSVTWTTRNRNEFIRAGGFVEKPGAGGRKRENMTVGQESEFLAPYIEKASAGGIIVVSEIHKALETRLAGRSLSLRLTTCSTVTAGGNWLQISTCRNGCGGSGKLEKNSRKS